MTCDSRSARSGLPSVRFAAARVRVQRFGAFLSGMILPNIAAFLAWGLITALFTPGGWLPNPRLAALVSPMLMTLLPILIGFSGGRLVYGLRGGVVGAVATVGAIASSDVPTFIAAMAMGPLGGWAIQRLDERMPAVPPALQMLAANFSAAIVGMLLAIAALVASELKVVEVDAPSGVGQTGNADDTRLPAALQGGEQQTGEREVAEVRYAELELEAVPCGGAQQGRQQAGVVDQHVQRWGECQLRSGEGPDAGEIRQVELAELRAAAGGEDALHDRLAAGDVAIGDHDVIAAAGQLQRRLQADAARSRRFSCSVPGRL